MKPASGRGRKTTKQGMGRVWEENFHSPIFYAKSGGKRKNLKNSPLLTQKNFFLIFLSLREGVALKIFTSALLGG